MNTERWMGKRAKSSSALCYTLGYEICIRLDIGWDINLPEDFMSVKALHEVHSQEF
jgi:hypothetical protein